MSTDNLSQAAGGRQPSGSGRPVCYRAGWDCFSRAGSGVVQPVQGPYSTKKKVERTPRVEQGRPVSVTRHTHPMDITMTMKRRATAPPTITGKVAGAAVMQGLARRRRQQMFCCR